MSKIKRGAILLLAALLFVGAFSSCGKKTNDLKKGTIEKKETEIVEDPAWKSLTTAARNELDGIYQQKLAATQAFADLPAISGKTYYISSLHGNDKNDGTSPESPWKSPEKANDAKIQRGDAVLFECGSVFRRTANEYFFKTKSGVVYGSYGSGEKPIFYGSLRVSAKQWIPVEGKSNLYYYDGGFLFMDLRNDIGSIVFNDGEAWGIKIQMTYNDPETKQDPKNKTLALEGVSNGLETFASIPSYSLKNGADLKTYDLSFYYDYTSRRVYLYCKGGNPCVRFRSVELSLNQFAFQVSEERSDVTFLNMDFRYFGCDAIHPMGCRNVTIRNCSFFFMGGTVQLDFGEWRNYYTRMGNGITNYGACDGMTVENCYFDQMYDTAVSTQTVHNEISKNVTYRNNVMQNVWFGIELWAGDGQKDLEFSYVDVSGNYCRKIGEGLCTTRPDKVDPGTTYSVNAFIKFSGGPYEMHNSCSVTDNIIDGTNGKMLFCNYPKTNTAEDGVVFDRNTYVGTTGVDFARLFGKTTGTTYRYSEGGIAKVHALGIETGSTFYYTAASGQGADYDAAVDAMPLYTYKAANGVSLPFRVFLPEVYTAGGSYSLVTYLNMESASGNDNLQNVMASKKLISKLVEEDNAIILVPQCPSGTWTGLAVDTGNYSTASVAETDVMKAVAALIRDAAAEFHANRKYAVGVDAGAYAVSDLLVRHKDLVAAGVIIAGAGDPNASVGNAKVMIIHAEEDDEIPYENAEELAEAWGAEYKLIEDYQQMHDCWDYVAEHEDILGWLLTK